jgi:oxygen-independent coproporphyrinogen-3 oxidase
MEAPKDDVAQEHFMILLDTLESNGFIHYELSNFGKQNYFSKNNPLIGWEKYMGIGPSAHGYNGI